MKIIIFVSYTYPFIGSGLGQVALAQAEGLVKKGHKVVLVSSNVPKTKTRFYKKGVLHLKQNGTNILDKFKIPVPLFLFNHEVLERIKSSDLIHSHDMLYPYSLQAAIFAKIFRKPFILTQHAGFIQYPNRFINLLQIVVNKTLGTMVLKLSDEVMVVNDEVKKWLGKEGRRAITLMNGIDNKLFHPVSLKRKKQLRKKYGFSTDKKIVLYVGRLVEKKGFHRLYETRSDDYLTLIAGGGDIPDHMNNEREKIIFLGALTQEKLSEVYQLSDIFVLPSDCEGFPLSIQEAMATGLPVISSNHPGFEKYLDKKFVKLIDPTNDNLKKTIHEVISDKELRKKMSDYSIKTIEIRASWENNLSKLEQIYERS